jgi:hypothetical protein
VSFSQRIAIEVVLLSYRVCSFNLNLCSKKWVQRKQGRSRDTRASPAQMLRAKKAAASDSQAL